MPEHDPEKNDIYMICPWCRSVAYNHWADAKLGQWTNRHIKRQECRK